MSKDSCTEWTQRGSLGPGATHLAHYKNCTKRLYCAGGSSHSFKAGETLDVNKCNPTSGNTSGSVTFACPANDPFVWCSKKIPSASILPDINYTTPDWQTCQRKCHDHGDACQGWAFSKSGKCQFGPSRQQSSFVYDTNWIGGPRHNPDSRSAVDTNGDTSNDTSDDDDTSDTSESTSTTTSEKNWLKDWRVWAGVGASSVMMLFFVVVVIMMTMKK